MAARIMSFISRKRFSLLSLSGRANVVKQMQACLSTRNSISLDNNILQVNGTIHFMLQRKPSSENVAKNYQPPILGYSTRVFELGTREPSIMSFFNQLPAYDSQLSIVQLPANTTTNTLTFGLPSYNICKILDPNSQSAISEPDDPIDRSMQLKHGMLKIRRRKMNKHKYQKRRKRDFAKRTAVMFIRAKKKAQKRATAKKILIEKYEEIKKNNPKSDFLTRPYVVYRLQNW